MAGTNGCTLLAVLCLLAGCQAQSIAESIAAARNGGTAAAAADPTAVGTTTTAAAASPADAPAVAIPTTPGVQPQLGGGAPSGNYNAPVAKYLSDTNSSFFSITWLAFEAANLADSLNTDDLAVTIFVPTNEAWQKALPGLTTAKDIAAHDLFSVGKADALRGIMQYHILQTVIKSAIKIQGALSTSSNLCSNAKDLKAVQSEGSIQLQSAGGSSAYLVDIGKRLGVKGATRYSTIYPIDNVLLPDVVTIPLNIALQAYTAQVARLAPSLEAAAPQVAALDAEAAAGPVDAAAGPAAGTTTAAAGR